jgi:hypothetical protein
MANEPTLTDDDLALIRSRIQSEAEQDRAQLPADAAALLEEVDALRVALAARNAHITAIDTIIAEKDSQIESIAAELQSVLARVADLEAAADSA